MDRIELHFCLDEKTFCTLGQQTKQIKRNDYFNYGV